MNPLPQEAPEKDTAVSPLQLLESGMSRCMENRRSSNIIVVVLWRVKLHLGLVFSVTILILLAV